MKKFGLLRYIFEATSNRIMLVYELLMAKANNFLNVNLIFQVNDFVCISDKSYTHDQVLTMEKEILGQLEWYLTVPTPYVFLVRFIKAAVSNAQVSLSLS